MLPIKSCWNGRHVSRASARRVRPGQFLSVLFALLLSAAPSPGYAEVSFDELFRLLIIGRWEQVSEVYAVSEFSSNMRYQANVYRSALRQEQLGHLEGVWRVEGGQLIIRLTKAIPPGLPVGVSIAEKIELLNGRKLVLIDAEGERYTKLRLR